MSMGIEVMIKFLDETQAELARAQGEVGERDDVAGELQDAVQSVRKAITLLKEEGGARATITPS